MCYQITYFLFVKPFTYTPRVGILAFLLSMSGKSRLNRVACGRHNLLNISLAFMTFLRLCHWKLTYTETITHKHRFASDFSSLSANSINCQRVQKIREKIVWHVGGIKYLDLSVNHPAVWNVFCLEMTSVMINSCVVWEEQQSDEFESPIIRGQFKLSSIFVRKRK